MSTDELCPCGSGHFYATCCEPLHSGASIATNAEALMRSRYSAFVKKLSGYLMDTRHPESRHHDSIEELQASFHNTRWLDLSILSTEKGQLGDTNGYVSFAARYADPQEEKTLYERSLFRMLDGRWFYVEGDFNSGRNTGRNDPCWCGSDKKFKKCHGR